MYVFIERKSMKETLESNSKPSESWLSRRGYRMGENKYGKASDMEPSEKNKNNTASVYDLH